MLTTRSPCPVSCLSPRQQPRALHSPCLAFRHRHGFTTHSCVKLEELNCRKARLGVCRPGVRLHQRLQLMTESCTTLLSKSITSKRSYWLRVKVEVEALKKKKLSLLGKSCCYHSQSWRERRKQILQKFSLAFFLWPCPLNQLQT